MLSSSETIRAGCQSGADRRHMAFRQLFNFLVLKGFRKSTVVVCDHSDDHVFRTSFLVTEKQSAGQNEN